MGKQWAWLTTTLVFLLGLMLMSCAEENQVRTRLLEETPIGSSFDQVLAYCKKMELKCSQSSTAGFLNQDTGDVVGVMSIWAVISEQRTSPLSIRSTAAYWGFGNDGKLLDIWVWKTTDAP